MFTKKNPLVDLICAQPYEKWRYSGYYFTMQIGRDYELSITPHGSVKIGPDPFRGNEAVKHSKKIETKYAELEYEMVKRELGGPIPTPSTKA